MTDYTDLKRRLRLVGSISLPQDAKASAEAIERLERELAEAHEESNRCVVQLLVRIQEFGDERNEARKDSERLLNAALAIDGYRIECEADGRVARISPGGHLWSNLTEACDAAREDSK